MITAENVTDELIRALRHEAREVVKVCRENGENASDLEERIRACNAALGLPTGDGALGLLDQHACRARVAAILENSRQCGTLESLVNRELGAQRCPKGFTCVHEVPCHPRSA